MDKTVRPRRLKNWDDVNNHLKRLADLDQQAALISSNASSVIGDIKTDTDQKLEAIRAEREPLEQAIKAYCDANPSAFGERKTLQLGYGSVGYRQTTDLVIDNPAETLSLIKKLRKRSLLRVTEAIDKAALRKLTAKQLATVKARLDTHDAFSYSVRAVEASP